MNILCLLGFHKIELIKYPGLNKCIKVYVCVNCSYEKDEQRKEHHFGDRLDSPSACSVRECEDCGYIEEMAHDWQPWEYANAGSCEQVQIRQNCGNENSHRQTVHTMGAWNYESDTSCHGESICVRCGHKEGGEEKHIYPDAWVTSSTDPCEQEIICQRCGKKGKRTSHDWGEWEYFSEHGCEQLRQCQVCSVMENRVAHAWVTEREYHIDGMYGDFTDHQQCKRCGA